MTDESEHFSWWDDVKVPCGKLVSSGHDDSPLEYNEYAAYDPEQVKDWVGRKNLLLHGCFVMKVIEFAWFASQVSIQFLVGVKYEEKDMEMDNAE